MNRFQVLRHCLHHQSPRMSQAYLAEEQVAVAAVRRACRLTSSVFNKLVKRSEVLTKGDKSPVTGNFYIYILLFRVKKNHPLMSYRFF